MTSKKQEQERKRGMRGRSEEPEAGQCRHCPWGCYRASLWRLKDKEDMGWIGLRCGWKKPLIGDVCKYNAVRSLQEKQILHYT